MRNRSKIIESRSNRTILKRPKNKHRNILRKKRKDKKKRRILRGHRTLSKVKQSLPTRTSVTCSFSHIIIIFRELAERNKP